MKNKSTVDPSFAGALEDSQKANYLGNITVIDNLLRTFAKECLDLDAPDEEAFVKGIEIRAKALAWVLLGNDPKMPGPAWNRPSGIGVHVGTQEGVDSTDPIERVAGGLYALVEELMKLSEAMNTSEILPEQWQWQSKQIIQKYVALMMGLPTSGYSNA